MKMGKKMVSFIQKGVSLLMFALLSKSALARDLLEKSMDGDVHDTFSANAKFWTIFILIDIILATVAAVATNNPKVFLGVAAITFIPAFLIKTFVF